MKNILKKNCLGSYEEQSRNAISLFLFRSIGFCFSLPHSLLVCLSVSSRSSSPPVSLSFSLSPSQPIFSSRPLCFSVCISLSRVQIDFWVGSTGGRHSDSVGVEWMTSGVGESWFGLNWDRILAELNLIMPLRMAELPPPKTKSRSIARKY